MDVYCLRQSQPVLSMFVIQLILRHICKRNTSVHRIDLDSLMHSIACIKETFSCRYFCLSILISCLTITVKKDLYGLKTYVIYRYVYI